MGRNFNRPSFKRLIADIEAGKVGRTGKNRFTGEERERLKARNREIDDMFLNLYTDKAKGILSELQHFEAQSHCSPTCSLSTLRSSHY